VGLLGGSAARWPGPGYVVVKVLGLSGWGGFRLRPVANGLRLAGLLGGDGLLCFWGFGSGLGLSDGGWWWDLAVVLSVGSGDGECPVWLHFEFPVFVVDEVVPSFGDGHKVVEIGWPVVSIEPFDVVYFAVPERCCRYRALRVEGS